MITTNTQAVNLVKILWDRLGLRRIVSLARADAQLRPLRNSHRDSPESAVSSLIRRIVAKQVLRLQLGRDLPEYFLQSAIAVWKKRGAARRRCEHDHSILRLAADHVQMDGWAARVDRIK